jgi:hypothetical protein
MKKCIGCGAELQSIDKTLPGYIDSSNIEGKDYCERCFKIINYNYKSSLHLDNINKYVLDTINKDKKYVLYLIDFLNLNTETINTFKSIKCPKTLIITKIDIIPKSIKEENLVNFIREEYNIEDDIALLSSRSNINTSVIYKILEANNYKESYIVGYTNSGKSTLLNKLKAKSGKVSDITVSLIPNTTANFIEIDLEDIKLFDSPGFVLNKTLYNDDEYDLIKRINPTSYLKPITMQTKENMILNLEDKLYFNTDNINSLTFYISYNLKLDKLFNKDIKNSTTIDIQDNTDIVIKSIGFINIKKACKLTINKEYKDLIELRKSFFRGAQNDEN